MPPETAFRCSLASEAADESIRGTAPTDARWLFVEQSTAWEPKVRLTHADTTARVQLIRRPGGGSGAGAPDKGVRVFWAELSASGAEVRTGTVGAVEDAMRVRPGDLVAHDEPLWFVCAHGRRDVCCAERGRPVAAALAARWPAATWETTHLGGHRFSATLLALPSGIALGRLDAGSSVAAATELLAGRLPVGAARGDVVRGRAGVPAAAQVAEAHVREVHGLFGLGEAVAAVIGSDRVAVTTAEATYDVVVESTPGEPRRQSCGDEKLKAAPTYRARIVG